MVVIICVSIALVAPNAGTWQFETLRYSDEEYCDDFISDDNREILDAGGSYDQVSWNKEYHCHYFRKDKFTDEEIAAKIKTIIKDIK